MWYGIVFVIGFLGGFAVSYAYFQPVHAAFQELDKKYTNLVAIITEWQKKI